MIDQKNPFDWEDEFDLDVSGDGPIWPVLLALGFVMFLVGIALMARPASAHSFYPLECCSDKDCWPMGRGADAREPDPIATEGGWRLFDGTVIPYANTRPSPDGRFHVCRRAARRDGHVITPTLIPGQERKPACLWVPSFGS